MANSKPVLILLNKDVKNVGAAGQIKTVKAGFARNFLIPMKFGVLATAPIIAEAKARAAKKESVKSKSLQVSKDLADKINGLELILRVKAGQKGKLFGAITAKSLAEALYNQHSVRVNDTQFVLSKPIKSLGQHTVKIGLGNNLQAGLKIKVLSSKK